MQVKGERSLAGPRGRGLAGSLRAAGDNADDPCFSLPGNPAGRSVPCPLRAAPFSPLGTPHPGKLHDGLDPGAVGGVPGCGGQDTSPAPSPPAALPAARALPLGSSLFTVTSGRNQTDSHHRGRWPGTWSFWRGPPRRGRPSRVAPSLLPPSAE